MASQSIGGQKLKKQTTEHYKVHLKHPKTSLYVVLVAIRVQRWFVQVQLFKMSKKEQSYEVGK